MNPSEHVYFRQVSHHIDPMASTRQKRDAQDADLDTPEAKVRNYLEVHSANGLGQDRSDCTPLTELNEINTTPNHNTATSASAESVALVVLRDSSSMDLDGQVNNVFSLNISTAAEDPLEVPLEDPSETTCSGIFPPEIIVNILKNLPLKELARLCSVNRAFRDLGKYAMVQKINDPHFSFTDLGFKDKDQILIFLRSLGADNTKLITHLNFKGILIDNEFLKELSTLTPNLQSLDLTNCDSINDEGLAHLAELTQLQSLNLAWCRLIGDNGLSYLAFLTELESLNLSGLKLTKHGLAQLVTLTKLESLNLRGCFQLTDDDLAYVALLPQLRSLDLSFCKKITGDGLTYLTQLIQLQSLNLSNLDQLTNDSLARLSQLEQLRNLDLSFCKQITDDSLVYLALLLELQSLNLMSCEQITNNGLARLAQLRQLLSLDLSFCYLITDDGLAHLTQLMQLEHLKLTTCYLITQAAKIRLMSQIPGLQIDRFTDLKEPTANRAASHNHSS